MTPSPFTFIVTYNLQTPSRGTKFSYSSLFPLSPKNTQKTFNKCSPKSNVCPWPSTLIPDFSWLLWAFISKPQLNNLIFHFLSRTSTFIKVFVLMGFPTYFAVCPSPRANVETQSTALHLRFWNFTQTLLKIQFKLSTSWEDFFDYFIWCYPCCKTLFYKLELNTDFIFNVCCLHVSSVVSILRSWKSKIVL